MKPQPVPRRSGLEPADGNVATGGYDHAAHNDMPIRQEVSHSSRGSLGTSINARPANAVPADELSIAKQDAPAPAAAPPSGAGEGADAATQKRARWRGYFERQLTGGDAEVDAATEAAMQALERGADVDAIIAAGLEGARSFRTYGTFPVAAQPDADAGAPPDGARRVQSPGPSPGQGHPAGHAAPVTPAGDSRGPGSGSGTTGIVSGLQQREVAWGLTSFVDWSFWLQRTDSAGNRLTPIPVVMRGRRFRGQISNGDLVKVRKRPPTPGKVVRARRVRNLTVGADVKAIFPPNVAVRRFSRRFLTVLVRLWILLIAVYVVAQVVRFNPLAQFDHTRVVRTQP